jgi:Zn-dependent protease
MFYGWPYAVGMVGMLFVHELGHALVMLRLGIQPGPMVFMPFLGAVVEMKDLPRDAFQEALVAFGGPLLGSIGAVACAGTGLYLESQLLIALADFGLMINLFNLIPFGNLDGGRILGALSKWFLVGGLTLMGTLLVTGALKNPLMFLVLIGGAVSTWQRFRGTYPHPPGYYNINFRQRASIAFAYFGLVTGLLIFMQYLNQFKKSLEELKGLPRVDYYAEVPEVTFAGEHGGELEGYSGSLDGAGRPHGDGTLQFSSGDAVPSY